MPTWNYLVVHAYGTPKIIDDPADVRATLARLAEVHEVGRSPAWQFESLPSDFVDDMVRGIVAFEIPIARLEGKWKLSQNRSDADRKGVIQGLRGQDDPMPHAVAKAMAKMMGGE